MIVSDAGGLHLQVLPGITGWITPAGEVEPVAQLFYDVYRGTVKLSTRKEGRVGSKSGSGTQTRHASDNASRTREEFWTVGNASKWMLISLRHLETKHDLIKRLNVEIEEGDVWRQLMGSSAIEFKAMLK